MIFNSGIAAKLLILKIYVIYFCTSKILICRS
jgi:hypothetical protein